MEHIREYILSVTAAAMICSILRSIVGEKGSAAGILKVISGLFLAFTMVRPLADIQINEFPSMFSEFSSDAGAAVEDGIDYAQSAKARRIKEQAEAYILDKASRFGAAITVEVLLHEETLVPVGCIVQGEVSPYTRRQLKQIMEADLGIREEDQQWIP